MPRPVKLLVLAALFCFGAACAKDASAPNALTTMSGRWVSSDTVEVFTGFDLKIMQDEKGSISGNWVGKTRITNGQCDATFGCAPSNIVFGSNLNLRIDLEILGAGSFTGQLRTTDELEGQINRFGVLYKLRLHKTD